MDGGAACDGVTAYRTVIGRDNGEGGGRYDAIHVGAAAAALPEALVARFFQEGRWKEFQTDLIGEIRRTAADQPGRKGAKLAKEIFGKPAWTRPLRGEELLDERPVWRSGTNRQAVG